MNLEEIIHSNLQSDFKVLREHIFYNQNQILLGDVFRKEQYNSKIFRSDQDGCWEEKEKLCDIILEEMEEENNELRQNEVQLYEIYEKPLETQEPELLDIYKQCNLTASQILYANKKAANRFLFGKNSLKCVSSLRRAGYRFLVYSGSFSWLIIQKNNEEIARHPLALQRVWRRMGLPENQINGSNIYCNEKGTVVGLNILIEQRKGELIEKELYKPWMYGIVLTDKIISDSSMVEGSMVCGVDTLPIAFVVEEFETEELPSGLMLYCPEGKEDKMEIFDRVMKIERGLVEYLGATEEQRIQSRRIAKEIKDIFGKISTVSENDFSIYRDSYLEKALKFLDLLRLRFPKGEFNLFPERMTGIRERLNSVKYENDLKEDKKLLQETFEILKKYSPEF